MDKYIIAPPDGSTNNGIGAEDRPWAKGHFNKLPNWQEYLAESTGYGIVSGCEPTISGLTVTVGAGIVHLADGTRKEIASTNITLDNADSTNPRIDLVYIDSTGAVAKITGTASASPVVPSVPSGGISVAQVSVAAGATTGTVNHVQTIAPNLANYGIVNVKDFGAVGDGVTDDTDAIQAAIDYAVKTQAALLLPAYDTDNNKDSSVVFHHRGYLVTRTINIKGLSKWIGAGSSLVVHSNNFTGDYVLINCNPSGTYEDIQAWLYADHIWIEDLDQRATPLNGAFLRLNHAYIDLIGAYQFNGTGINFSPCYDCVLGEIHVNCCGNDNVHALIFSGSGDQCNCNTINYIVVHDFYQHGINMVMVDSTINTIHIEGGHVSGSAIGTEETIYGTPYKNHYFEGGNNTFNVVQVSNGTLETFTIYSTVYNQVFNNMAGSNIEVNITGNTKTTVFNSIYAEIVATSVSDSVAIYGGEIGKLKSNSVSVYIEKSVVRTIELFAGSMHNVVIVNKYIHKDAYMPTAPKYDLCTFVGGIGNSPRGGNIECYKCKIAGITLDANENELAGTFYFCTFSDDVILDGKGLYTKSIAAYYCVFGNMTWQNLAGGDFVTVGCRARNMTGWITPFNAAPGQIVDRIYSSTAAPASGTGLKYICTNSETWPATFAVLQSMP